MDRTDELRRRVGRLMAGERNTRDLDVLFLWLRERSFGNDAVADVGDFVAHSDEREKGVAWRGIQSSFNVARFVLPRVGHTAKPPGTLEHLKDAALSAFELSRPEDVLTHTGLGKKKAKRILASAIEALASLDGKNLSTKRPLTPKEAELLQRYTSVLISRAAFTGDDLVSQLFVCLLKNRLIEHLPPEPPAPFCHIVELYGIEKMHRAQITLKDGKVARLKGGILKDGGKEFLGVTATSPLDLGEFEIGISFPIYITNLEPWDWCEPELLPPHRLMGSNWEFALEIGASGRLQML